MKDPWRELFMFLDAHPRLSGYIRELQFVPGRRYRADIVLPAHRIIVELDGGIYGRGKPCRACKRRPVGAHSSIVQQENDREKTNAATILCYRTLRFTPSMVRDGYAFAALEAAISASPSVPKRAKGRKAA